MMARIRPLARTLALSAALLVAPVSVLLATELDPNNTNPAGGKTNEVTPPSQTPPPAADPAVEFPNAIPVPDGPAVERKELEGGLIIEDIKIGEGMEVKPGSAVVAHYHGTLKADPTVIFDSSFRRGEPAAFPLSGVIAGWQKGVPGMKVGGVRRLIIPADLAYGSQQKGADIPPNSDLVFIIQLLDALFIEDIKEGTGPAAEGQFLAVTTHTITNEAGEVVDRADAANPYVWLPGEMMSPMSGFDAMQAALTGMKIGGKRKIMIPAQFNPPAPPQLNVKRPTNTKITIEAELIAVRVLPMQQRR